MFFQKQMSRPPQKKNDNFITRCSKGQFYHKANCESGAWQETGTCNNVPEGDRVLGPPFFLFCQNAENQGLPL